MKFISLIMILALTSCATKNTSSALSEYKEKASTLIKLNKENADAKTLKNLGLELINMAKPIIAEQITKLPKCDKLLNTIIDRSDAMTKMSLEEIEVGYHGGEALPESPVECYDAKELIVHPATVVVLTNKALTKTSRDQIHAEIEELLEHLGDLK
ncbi:MAG: hypothetical protein ACPGJV_08980 [Bacteriovoracaceae bacterium]